MNVNFKWAAVALALSFGSHAQVDLIKKVEGNGTEQTASAYEFETLVDLEATAVKNQGRSGTCWSYATTSFLESELLRQGKEPIDLSEMFTVRQVYLDKAEKYVRLHGNLNFAQGGALPDVLYVIKKYGAVPQEVYSGLEGTETINNHGELEAILVAQVKAVIKNENGTINPKWRTAFEATLDAYLGAYPETFTYKGVEYTPRTFADTYLEIKPDDYVQLTSWTHQPMNEPVMIQVPDNWAWGTAYNVPLADMMEAINHSLNEGYTVSWATDVSEKGFSLRNGLALVPAKEKSKMTEAEKEALFVKPIQELDITPAVRQAAYDNYSTTDDHGMQITGLVKDQTGTNFYMVKNSWGERENDKRPGYIYASEAFVKYKTIGVLMHKDALPKKLKKRFSL